VIKPLAFLVVHSPAFDTQKFGNLAIAITAILLGQPDHVQPQSFIIFGCGFVLLGATANANNPAGTAL